MLRALTLAALLIVTALPVTAGVKEGISAYKRGDYSTAFREFKALAEQGDARSQGIIGAMYAKGYGVLKNYALSIKWLRMAARQSDADAQTNLGVMYAKGLGVPRNYALAIKWYRKAAMQGDAKAQYALGGVYSFGPSVLKNEREAIKWYRKAAEQGHTKAQYNLGVQYERGLGVPKNYREAVRWYRKAVKQGDAGAQYNLGLMYYLGHGVPRNYALAIKWFRKGAMQGNANAQFGVGNLYRKGQGVPRNYVLAYMWYSHSAAQGNNKAAKNIDLLEKRMTPADVSRAQAMAAKWKPKKRRRVVMKRSPPVKQLPPMAAVRPAPAVKTFKDCAQCPDMVVIPDGSFLMGSNAGDSDEKPVHQVTVGRFAMGKYEVTFAQWDACVAAGGCSHRPGDEGWGRGRRPVINVSWRHARQYVAWLSRETGKRYRLPSEAEWEYAARAGTQTAYWWGDAIGSGNANCSDCDSRWDNRRTAPVGSFRPNRFGLYDVSGNVDEWVEDCWHKTYAGAPTNGRPWTTGGNCRFRVLRGGSWLYNPKGLLSASRVGVGSGFRVNGLGFRVARTLP